MPLQLPLQPPQLRLPRERAAGEARSETIVAVSDIAAGSMSTPTIRRRTARIGSAPARIMSVMAPGKKTRTYTVIAGDASTQAYTVTATVATAAIGQTYGGGVIAYVYQSGDPGYVAGETHGLIAAVGDQSSMGIQWSIGSNCVTTGATGVALGTGAANTTAIIATQGAPAISYAAGLARAYKGGGYADWYLPSRDELRKLYLSRVAIGGSWSALFYGSSSENSSVSAWLQNFANGNQTTDVKQDLQGVHAVRSF